MGPVATIPTKVRGFSTFDLAFSIMNRPFKCVEMGPAVHLKLQSGLLPFQRSTASFSGHLYFLHLVDPVQETISAACLSH
jgi:hypothetical protein